MSDTNCDDCISGDKSCDEQECFLNGRCDGDLVDFVEGVSTPADCLAACQDTSGCGYWSHNLNDTTCILTSNCALVAQCEVVEDCIYGQETCGQ